MTKSGAKKMKANLKYKITETGIVIGGNLSVFPEPKLSENISVSGTEICRKLNQIRLKNIA